MKMRIMGLMGIMGLMMGMAALAADQNGPSDVGTALKRQWVKGILAMEGDLPSAPATNAPALTNSSFAPLAALGAFLPSWDPTLTNTFGSGELSIGIGPLWKTMSAAGGTPYMSTYADYFFTKNIGAEGELVSFGDGTGTSTVDSATLQLLARKDMGNLAGFIEAGAARSFVMGRFGGEGGGGIEYRAANKITTCVDTRYEYFSKASTGNGFETRAAVSFPF